MDDWRSVLQSEFEAEAGSLLIRIRGDLVWDADALDRLIAAMEACCRATAEEKLLDRWIAEGFWYMSWFVKDWTSHPNFPRRGSDEYYKAVYEYLDSLAYWFFFGESQWTDNGVHARAELSRLQAISIITDWKD